MADKVITDKPAKVTVTSLNSLAAAATTNNQDEDILRAAQQHQEAGVEQETSDSSEEESESESEEEEDSKPAPASISKTSTTYAAANPFLQTLLKHHRCQEWITRLHWKRLRNQREAVTIAACLDSKKKVNLQDPVVQILIARLQAVRLADYTKSWTVAQQLEKVPQPGAEIIPEAILKAAVKRSRLYKQAIQPNEKEDDEEEEDEEPK